ncbi:hypothetical protein [Streptomyces sp. NBC_01518]|uniref:hypothetical protein n=1 Tax=Streptomyces sp. NBC_01518 TaxID=2903891 RepID=UPI00386EB361
MAVLVTGVLSGNSPRTVTGMWQAAGLAGKAHWSRAHRFFSRAVWDLDQVGLALARAVVARFVPRNPGGLRWPPVPRTPRHGGRVRGFPLPPSTVRGLAARSCRGRDPGSRRSAESPAKCRRSAARCLRASRRARQASPAASVSTDACDPSPPRT